MKTPNLYLPAGWLDIASLAEQDCWLTVIIGPRQVGKTYGTLKYLLDQDQKFIYLRRTIDELDLITSSPEYNPFLDLEGYNIEMVKEGKGYVFGEVEENEKGRKVLATRRGVALPLSSIAKVRGFSGSQFTDLMLDEFIPEKMVIVRKAEGDAFRNALITIAGNRKQKGLPPLRVWMLANANDLFSPIMVSMNITQPVEKMMRQHKEYLRTENGVQIVLPKSDQVIKERLKDPMLRHLNQGDAFAAMAFSNSFGYNDTSMIRPKSIKGWKPYIKAGDIYIWERGDFFYCSMTTAFNGKREYGKTETERNLCEEEHPYFYGYYMLNSVTFSDAMTMFAFKQYFNIKT